MAAPVPPPLPALPRLALKCPGAAPPPASALPALPRLDLTGGGGMGPMGPAVALPALPCLLLLPLPAQIPAGPAPSELRAAAAEEDEIEGRDSVVSLTSSVAG